jgi:S-DNA-T family DNA segregation ATPase FtsK/SpoIIIE
MVVPSRHDVSSELSTIPNQAIRISINVSLRYRICLRTFSPAESAAVLGTPDAFHLPPSPGHGLLKVDSGPYHRFRSLLVSTPAAERAAGGPEPPAPALVLPFDPIAQPTRPLPADGPLHWSTEQDGGGGRVAQGGPGGTLGDPVARGSSWRGDLDGRGSGGRGDLDAVAAAMAPLARAGRRTHRIWLPPLAPTITLDQVLRPIGSPAGSGEPEWLRVAVGIVDRPFDQSQEPLFLDFSGRFGHLAIAGAPRSGKSTLLATLVTAFALTHRPEQAQFYCVDLGGGVLHELACLPHVGAVLGAGEPTEIRRLVRELRALITAREELFRHRRLASMAAWHARRAAEPALGRDGYGEVFLVVDNWSRLRQELGDLEHEIESVAGAGLHYGVHLVVAANRWADLRLALRDNIGGRLELRLNDPIESEVGRAAAARLPERLPGRGLTMHGHEFQVALPVLSATASTPALESGPTLPGGDPLPGVRDLDADRADAVREVARQAVRSTTGAGAPPLRPLPALVPAEDLYRPGPSPPHGAGQTGGVPFALHDHRLEVVRLDLAAAPHFLVFGDPESGKTATLRCLAQGLMARHPPDEMRLVVVDYRRTLLHLAGAPHCDAYTCAPSTTAEAVGRLRSLLDRRLPRSAGPPEVDRRPRYVLVVDDYDLVATARGNPLEPLLELAARGRDVGLHVLLARPVSGTARSSFEPLYQRLRETGCPGLIMSGDPREGPLLGGQAATLQPAGRGHLVARHGRSGLIQVAWSPPRPPAAPPGAATSPASTRPPRPPGAEPPPWSAGAPDVERGPARSGPP